MNIVGERIRHKVLGDGEIVDRYSKNGKYYVIVRFDNVQKHFAYKQLLELFEITNDGIRREIEAAYAEQLKAEELEKQKEAEAQELRRKEREEFAELKRREIEAKRRAKPQNSESRKNGKHTRSEIDKNIIFKCIFCDGGSTNSRIGFCGICSPSQRQYNLKYHKTGWCNVKSFCRKYSDGLITLADIKSEYARNSASVCYEANLFNGWQYAAGVDNRGPRTIGRDVTNRLCILTTQMNNNSERYIFGLFLIEEYYKGDKMNEGRVYAHPKYRIELTESEMLKMPLEKYYDTEWNQGLFRYTNNSVAKAILTDIELIKHEPAEKQLIREFYAEYCVRNNLEP